MQGGGVNKGWQEAKLSLFQSLKFTTADIDSVGNDFRMTYFSALPIKWMKPLNGTHITWKFKH